MPPSEVEKIFQAFAEKRKAELPRFTPDGIPITMENKFDDAIYNYLYAYWKEQSGEYDPKKDVIPESEMNKMHPKTKNEFQFEKWLLQQYGMTKKEERGYTLEGNLESLWEIFSAADMVLFARGLPSIGKELAQLGKKAVDDVAEEAIEKTVKKEAAEEIADTAEDLSRNPINKNDALENSSSAEAKIPRTGDEWYEYFNEKYGKGNVTWKPTSFDDILQNPERLYGSTQEEIANILGDGWTAGNYGITGEGWKFTSGDRMVFYHSGGRHGGVYYGFSTSLTGKVKIVGENYIPLPGDKATVIYFKGSE